MRTARVLKHGSYVREMTIEEVEAFRHEVEQQIAADPENSLLRHIHQLFFVGGISVKAIPEFGLAGHSSRDYGGIDFAQKTLDLQIKRDGAGVPLPISQQNLDNIRIEGLVPVILDIRPASGVPSLMQ